jgi:hypothetical protein
VTQWLEKGVFQALQDHLLETLTLAIHTIHPKKKSDLLLEKYEFKIDYHVDEKGNRLPHAINGTHMSKSALKTQANKFVRNLVSLSSTLDDLPQELSVTMELSYVDGCPDDYQPQFFRDATGAGVGDVVGENVLKIKFGSVKSGLHDLHGRFTGFEHFDDDSLCAMDDKVVVNVRGPAARAREERGVGEEVDDFDTYTSASQEELPSGKSQKVKKKRDNTENSSSSTSSRDKENKLMTTPSISSALPETPVTTTIMDQEVDMTMSQSISDMVIHPHNKTTATTVTPSEPSRDRTCDDRGQDRSNSYSDTNRQMAKDARDARDGRKSTKRTKRAKRRVEDTESLDSSDEAVFDMPVGTQVDPSSASFEDNHDSMDEQESDEETAPLAAESESLKDTPDVLLPLEIRVRDHLMKVNKTSIKIASQALSVSSEEIKDVYEYFCELSFLKKCGKVYFFDNRLNGKNIPLMHSDDPPLLATTRSEALRLKEGSVGEKRRLTKVGLQKVTSDVQTDPIVSFTPDNDDVDKVSTSTGRTKRGHSTRGSVKGTKTTIQGRKDNHIGKNRDGEVHMDLNNSEQSAASDQAVVGNYSDIRDPSPSQVFDLKEKEDMGDKDNDNEEDTDTDAELRAVVPPLSPYHTLQHPLSSDSKASHPSRYNHSRTSHGSSKDVRHSDTSSTRKRGRERSHSGETATHPLTVVVKKRKLSVVKDKIHVQRNHEERDYDANLPVLGSQLGQYQYASQ